MPIPEPHVTTAIANPTAFAQPLLRGPGRRVAGRRPWAADAAGSGRPVFKHTPAPPLSLPAAPAAALAAKITFNAPAPGYQRDCLECTDPTASAGSGPTFHLPHRITALT